MADDTKDPGTVHDLEAQLHAMTARMDEMAAELDALRGGSAGGRRTPDDGDTRRQPPAPDTAGAGPQPPGATPAPDPRISRRGALALGAAAAVGISAVADSVLSPTPAGATTGAMQYGASNNAGSSVTDLTSLASAQTLSLENTGNGSALTASGGLGNPSIYTASTGTYPAIYALAGNVADAANAVVVSTNGLGSALQAYVNNAADSSPGILLSSGGTGNGIFGYLSNALNGQAAVYGSSAGTGPGVEGQSASGYGLAGSGGAAPLFLTPAASPGAPSTGTHALGELYVDSGGVVYSCRTAGTPGAWSPVLLADAVNQGGVSSTYLLSTSSQVTLWAKNTGSGHALSGSDDGTGTGGGVVGQIETQPTPRRRWREPPPAPGPACWEAAPSATASPARVVPPPSTSSPRAARVLPPPVSTTSASSTSTPTGWSSCAR